MDCRKTLWGWLCLLTVAAGCQHEVVMTPAAPPPPAQTSAMPPTAHVPVMPPAVVQTVPPNAVVTKAGDLPKKTPHASTCVAGGDFFAQEALAPDMGETAKQANQEKARKAYQQAMSIDPHYLPAYESLANLYVAMKDHAHAVATYNRATQIFPNEPSVFFQLGVCHGGEKEWDPAIQNLSRAVQLDPENRRYVDTLGWMQARAGRYDESLNTFLKVHDEAEAHYRLALMLEHLKEIDLCRQQLQAALDKDPRMEKAHALLAQLNGGPPAPVQPTSYTEPAGPDTAPTDAALTPRHQGDRGEGGLVPKAVLLPPPPRFPILYESTTPLPPSGSDGGTPSTGGPAQ